MRGTGEGEAVEKGGVLVIQPLPGIGDMVWHIPHLRAIAGTVPEGRVSLLTKRRSMAGALLAGAAFVGDILYLAEDGGAHSGLLGGLRLGRDLARHRFDTIWILHNSPRYGLAAMRAGAGRRIGYGFGWQSAFLTSPHQLARGERRCTPIDKANRLLALHGLDLPAGSDRLPLTPEAVEKAGARLSGLPHRRIALAIGSSERAKQWGDARFTALIAALRESGAIGIVLIGGGDSDAQAAARITEHFGAPDWLVSILDAPLGEASAAISLCQLCVGNDTGVLNVAAAVAVPSIGLFGPTLPSNPSPYLTAITPEPGATPPRSMEAIPVAAVMRRISETEDWPRPHA